MAVFGCGPVGLMAQKVSWLKGAVTRPAGERAFLETTQGIHRGVTAPEMVSSEGPRNYFGIAPKRRLKILTAILSALPLVVQRRYLQFDPVDCGD